MPFVSYAQNYEDVMLWRAFKDVDKGFYVDVGAQDPIIDSVSKSFYENGWRGINIEPVASYAERLYSDRPEDVNLQVAVGNTTGRQPLFVLENTGMSTLVEEFSLLGSDRIGCDKASTVDVDVMTLNEILTAQKVQEIHWLKIDVEGYEAHVLQGLDLTVFSPWIVVVEAVLPNSTIASHQDWEPLLLQADYKFIYFDGLNRFYLSKDHPELEKCFGSPPNILDEFIRFSEYFALIELLARQQEIDALTAKLDSKQKLIANLTLIKGSKGLNVGHLLEKMDSEKKMLLKQNENFQGLNEVAHERIEILEQELDLVYNSLSWKLTTPLRKANEMVSCGQTSASFTQNVKQQLNGIMLRAIRWIERKPQLAFKLKQWILRYPRLRGYFISLTYEAAIHRDKKFYTDETKQHIAQDKPHEIHSLQSSANLHANDIFHTDKVMHIRPCGVRTIFYYVDHTIASSNHTGVQNVVKQLSRSLLENGENIVFVKWCSARKNFISVPEIELGRHRDSENNVQGSEPVVITGSDVISGDWLVVPEVPHIAHHEEDATLDVIIEARRLGLLSAFIYYDAIPLRRPEMTEIAERHRNYMQNLLLVDLILPISEFSGEELKDYFCHHEKTTASSMPTITSLPLPGECSQTERKTHVSPSEESEKLILSVGTIEPRKNQVALVKAFQRFCKTHSEAKNWRLVLAGNLHPSVAKTINKAVKQHRNIEYSGYCSDDRLCELYETCAFTVFPSIEEGFGLPILESLWNGKPCICADFGAMGEVAAEGGCLTVDTQDIEALEKAIIRLTTDEDFRTELGRQAISRPISTWQDYGRTVSALLDQKSNPLNNLGKIYYWVDHTASYPANSGIQRVVRGLAQSLIGCGLELIPVKWHITQKRFAPPTQQELEHLAKWNGPAVEGWAPWCEPEHAGPGDWLLVPELTTYLPAHMQDDLVAYLKAVRLRCSWIFHDAIPVTRSEFYPPEATRAHAAYMDNLAKFDLILPNSRYSKRELAIYLLSRPLRTHSFSQKFQTCILPGEFFETNRVREVVKNNAGIIRMLCVATVEPRKNHIGLLKAFKKLNAVLPGRAELTLVGKDPFPELSRITQTYIDDVPGIVWEKSVDDAQLQKLYSESDFTIFPSLEEGFGLPILESLWNGRPCICANFGAMAEVAEGGGCLTVDVNDVNDLYEAMRKLVTDADLRNSLGQQTVGREFKTWKDYAIEVATRMALECHIVTNKPETAGQSGDITRPNHCLSMVNLRPRPLLSICISTYNRADWLAAGLQNLTRLMPEPHPDIEIFVCDNTSEDHTPEVVKPYLERPDFRYLRNSKNVGMLGNLRVTAHNARGQYIWILGDDDLIKPGSIEHLLDVIRKNPDLALVYLNYSYTREDSPRSVSDFDKFIQTATPIVKPGPDVKSTIRDISTQSENFFTAIYCLIFRRDHALRAYSTNTEGRPFSSLPTCIPTTHYVLNYMMDEPGYWVGNPQLVINMNVSWMKYAPLWILERIPETLDLAERMGANAGDIDHWRTHHFPGVVHFWREIFENDEIGNAEYFSPMRLIMRLKNLPESKTIKAELESVYQRAHNQNHPSASIPTKTLFSGFDGVKADR